MLCRLFLLPVDVIPKLGMETFDVEAKHAVHAQLAQLSRISGSERVFFLAARSYSPVRKLEIRLSLLNPRLVRFEVKEQTAKLIATHNVLPGLGLLKYSHHRLLKKSLEAKREFFLDSCLSEHEHVSERRRAGFPAAC